MEERTQSRPSVYAGYGAEDEPLAGYTALVGVFCLAFCGLLIAARQQNKLPQRIKSGDLLLMGVATHKLSRLITKDRVTSPLRAPFTHFEKPAGKGELEESARGSGMQKAMGKLLTCPYCFGPWAASAFGFAFVFNRRVARFVAATLGILAISDALHDIRSRIRRQNQTR